MFVALLFPFLFTSYPELYLSFICAGKLKPVLANHLVEENCFSQYKQL